MVRWALRIVGGLLVVVCVVAAFGYREARELPIVRHATIRLPGWPDRAPPVTIALVSDIHMASAAMDEGRLRRIVAEVDSLHPDLVAIAGDFIEGRGRAETARALPILARQLGALHAPLGIVAVLGNHDHWTNAQAVAATLSKAGIVLLDNDAVERGPLAIGGAGDSFTGHADVGRTVAAMRRLPGARIMIAHSPNVVHRLPGDVHLLLAGHTHCGQVVLPLVGPPIDVADPRYRCGMVRDPRRLTIVTAGVGTSDLPIRLGAPPDIWLIRLEGTARSNVSDK
jgi:predicted MPP superfamily phosphohydrolase